jgi:hypothetical protein
VKLPLKAEFCQKCGAKNTYSEEGTGILEYTIDCSNETQSVNNNHFVLRTQLVDKGRPYNKILFFIAMTGIMIFFSYSNSRGISYDGRMSDWTQNHWIGLVSLILALYGIVAIIRLLRYGVFEAVCPYCQAKNELVKDAINLKCKACYKVSVRKGDWLE